MKIKVGETEIEGMKDWSFKLKGSYPREHVLDEGKIESKGLPEGIKIGNIIEARFYGDENSDFVGKIKVTEVKKNKIAFIGVGPLSEIKKEKP